ncbi:MAG: hypothetical protein U1C53_02510 [Candidatus Veblenbacteria bacterium]|nr:hypothetical protein [Candidatus Veblenbacteria bacterium]
MPDKTIAFRIPDGLKEALAERANGEPLSAYARRVLEREVRSRHNGGPVASMAISPRLLAQAKCRAELSRLDWELVSTEELVERYLEALVEHDRVVLKAELLNRRNV